MRCTTLFLIVLALATPSLAQGLPAIEGEGSQTQFIELLQDSVTITLDSASSVSLGRGNDAVSGSLGIGVNDLTIGNTRSDTDASPAPTHGNAADGQARSPSTGASTAVPVAGGQIVLATPLATASADACDVQSADADDLSAAIARGYAIALQETACSRAAPQVAQFAASTPAVPALIEAAGIAWESVVAITINNDTVTMHHTPSL